MLAIKCMSVKKKLYPYSAPILPVELQISEAGTIADVYCVCMALP